MKRTLVLAVAFCAFAGVVKANGLTGTALRHALSSLSGAKNESSYNTSMQLGNPAQSTGKAIKVISMPEPSTPALLALGLISLAGIVRWKRPAQARS